ncbi:MAG: HNH endonuclease, partial [Mycobacteriaceae bacterium]|nr:HNH endonuclease [Mycobacteriaceae bacterium]
QVKEKVEEIGYQNVVGQDSLTRFEKSFSNNNKNLPIMRELNVKARTLLSAYADDLVSTKLSLASPAELEAWMAKFAAPGMANPADQTALVEGEPSQAQADADTRSVAQRQHDALSVLLRSQLGNPTLGRHNGLPVTVIVSASIQDLHAKAGLAHTGGTTMLPMSDLIRMAGHAYHYLRIFDGISGRTLWLGRTKRIASADQRIVLHERDRGCTFPGCAVPGYGCQVHHATRDWAEGGNTDIDDLVLGCGPHNRLVTKDGWQTRKLPDGTTEWIPPPGLPLIGGVNSYHHPERLLGDR